MGGLILILLGFFLVSLVGAVLFWAVFGLCCLISFLFKGWLGGWIDRGQAGWFSRHGDVVLATVASVLTAAALLAFFFLFMPWWDAERDRNAPLKFIREWGSGERKSRQSWEVWWSPWEDYDDRAESDRFLFEFYSPTNIISVKETVDGVFCFIEPVQENRHVRTKEYIVETSGYSFSKTMPATMTMLLGVAVDSHKVCFVEDISPQQQKDTNAIIAGSGEQKSVEPDASSVRPAVPEPTATESPVDVAMTEGQLVLLRQDVLAVAAYEDWDRVEYLPGHLAECAGHRLQDWQLADNVQNREGQFMLGLYHAMGQPGGSNRVSGIEMLKVATDGMPEAGYWLGLLYVGGIASLKDYPEAEKWLLKAAWQGHVRAQYTLGILYGDKRLAMQNPDRSLGWLAKAAQQGLPEAQRDFDAKLREENKGGDGKLPPGFTRIELGADGKIRVGR